MHLIHQSYLFEFYPVTLLVQLYTYSLYLVIQFKFYLKLLLLIFTLVIYYIYLAIIFNFI